MNTIRVSNRLDPDQAQHVVTSAHSLPKNMLLLLKNTKIIKKIRIISYVELLSTVTTPIGLFICVPV